MIRAVHTLVVGFGIGLLALTSLVSTSQADELNRFSKPERLKGGDDYVKVEAPGYAAPCWADIDGDGKKDLLVGQFADGKIRVYKNLGAGKLAAGEWLQAEGEVAKVPGVW